MTNIFFYGLFMDPDILRARGVEPRAPRKASVPGWGVRIGRRAVLEPRLSARAFGMVYALTDREIQSLYAEPGLNTYRPQLLLASFEDGILRTVAAWNSRVAPGKPDPAYAAKLRAVLERLGLPSDGIRAIP
ncbi:MAG: gamma-glutamylcyclotransferase family protein [Candidatus Polarisedimenticolia bacterium]